MQSVTLGLTWVCFVSLITLRAAPLQPQQRFKLESFEYVWATIRDKHWDPKLGGLNWQAVHDELRPKMETSDSISQDRAVINEMIRRLGQSHVGIIPAELYNDLDSAPAAATDQSSEDGNIGIDVRVLTDSGNRAQVVVTTVDEGSAAAKLGVRPGWQILKINGKEVATLVESTTELLRNSPSRSITLLDLMLTRAILSKLSGHVGDRSQIEFLDSENKPIELEIPYRTPKGAKARFGYLPNTHVWIEQRKLAGNAGYIAFNFFLDPARVMSVFEDAVKTFNRCDGIVLDLRGNPGGIGAMAAGMAGWFIDKPEQRLGTLYLRDTNLKFVVNPRRPAYRGLLAILLDGASGSTSEILAGGLKDLKRARIFGTRSAGAALPSVIERLPNGDGFQYPLANYISEGGQALEGTGVLPDVEVAPTRQALLQGRDLALDAALSWIKAQKK
jgi:carboxyl-terminal processing protease